MLNIDLKVEWRNVTPWKFFNYGTLYSRGVDNVFNFLRYNHCFFVREQDIKSLLATAGTDHFDYTSKRLTILVCRHDEKGITRPGWSGHILTSVQEFEPISDPVKLMDLAPGLLASQTFRPSAPLKKKGTFTVTGNLEYVLRVMLDNKAYPDDEPTANRIEIAFGDPDKEFDANLCVVTAEEVQIKLPKKETKK
jgi:hypothetical protein